MSKPQKRNLYRGSTFLVFEYMDHDFAGLFRHKIRYSIPEVKVMTLSEIVHRPADYRGGQIPTRFEDTP